MNSFYRHIPYSACIFIVFWVLPLCAQHPSTLSPAAQQVLDSIQSELDYSTTHKEWTLRKFSSEEKSQEPESINFPEHTGLSIGPIFKFIMYMLIIAGILALVVLVVRGSRDINPEISTEFNALETEEDLINYDAVDAYQKALNAGDYRLALRMQFIQVLQYLAQQKYIRWRPEKTNRDYTRELQGQADFEHFKTLSAAFERVWYGNRAISEQEFHQYDAHFSHYLTQKT